jgi:HD-like signal output (HDOD) protein
LGHSTIDWRLIRWDFVVVPGSIERIAPFPPLAAQLLERIPSVHGEERDWFRLLEPEPELLAAIAGVAIRSELATAGEDDSPETILARVKSADLARIAVTIVVRGYMQSAFKISEDRRYWRYTLACAFCCSELAALSGDNTLVAHSAGLLHDIGRLALIAAYPQKYANLLALTDRMFKSGQEFNISEQERLLFGINRFATGAWLASTWKLPDWLHPVVGKFDEQASAEQKKLVTIVRAGTRFAHSLGFGYLNAAPRVGIREILKELPPTVWEQWRALDHWKYGELYMQTKIESQLQWYDAGSKPDH